MNILDRKLSEIVKGRLSRNPNLECKYAGKEGHMQEMANRRGMAFPNAIAVGLAVLSIIILSGPSTPPVYASVGTKVMLIVFFAVYALIIRLLWITGKIRHQIILERMQVSNE